MEEKDLVVVVQKALRAVAHTSALQLRVSARALVDGPTLRSPSFVANPVNLLCGNS